MDRFTWIQLNVSNINTTKRINKEHTKKSENSDCTDREEAPVYHMQFLLHPDLHQSYWRCNELRPPSQNLVSELDKFASLASNLLLPIEDTRHMYVTAPTTWEWGLPACRSWKDQVSRSYHSKHYSTYIVYGKYANATAFSMQIPCITLSRTQFKSGDLSARAGK